MTAINTVLYPTIPLLGVSGATLGYAGTANNSLGGTQAGAPLPTTVEPYPVTGPVTQHRLFPDVPAMDRPAGQVTYRGLLIQNDGAEIPALRVRVIQPLSMATVDFQVVLASTLPVLSSETQDPGGAFVNDYTLPVPFAAGALGGIWFRRTIPAGAAAYPLDYWLLELSAPGMTSQIFMFFQTLEVGVRDITASSDRSSLRIGETDTFTIRCFDSNGAPVDAGLQRVRTIVTKPANPGMSSTYPAIITEVGTCTREDLGVYSYTFRPEIPGFYTLCFDAGEWAPVGLQRNVLP